MEWHKIFRTAKETEKYVNPNILPIDLNKTYIEDNFNFTIKGIKYYVPKQWTLSILKYYKQERGRAFVMCCILAQGGKVSLIQSSRNKVYEALRRILEITNMPIIIEKTFIKSDRKGTKHQYIVISCPQFINKTKQSIAFISVMYRRPELSLPMELIHIIFGFMPS